MIKRFVSSVLVSAVVLCFCSPGLSATKIRVGYITDIDLIPFFVAMEKGYFKEQGLDIEAKEYTSGSDSLTALKGGLMDVNQNIGTNAAAKFNDVLGFKIIRLYMLPNFKILTQKEAPFKALEDLKGKAYAVTSFAGTSFAISAMAFNALGMDIKKDLEIKTFPPAVLQIELERSGVDAGILWEPMVSKVLKIGKLRVIVDPAEIYFQKFNRRFIQGCIGSTKEFFDSNQDALKKYLLAIDKGLDFTLKNKDEANRILAEKWKGITAEEIAEIRNAWGDGWIKEGINDQQIEEMQFMFDKMFELTDFFKEKPIAKVIMQRP
jgi:ABC-type nitrate/sulfonate/bicarbonate transport system substrate-binding protein